MWSSARTVAAGDTVIVWLTRDSLLPLVVAPGAELNTKFGSFRHADFVGVPYGSKVPARAGLGFVHLLRPTPELWTLALPHRTQILYLADIAFITAHLAIRPGATVCEAGTGSASFSHSVARTLGPAGRLYSYEFHEARFHKAQDEFARHGLAPVVRLAHRNVCKDGFTVVDAADAVFLDLPAPWDAVAHAKKALRKDRVARICCFSPCIEQVLRTVAALNDAGFTEITTYETLLRPLEVFQTPPLPSIAPLAARLKHAEARREDKRQRQIAANRAQAAAKEGRPAAAPAPAAAADADAEHEEGRKRKQHPSDGPAPDADAAAAPKRLKTSAGPAPSALAPAPASSDALGATTSAMPSTSAPTAPSAAAPAKVNVAKALAEVRGHTSYLTFAVLVPVPVPAGASVEEAEAEVEGVEAPVEEVQAVEAKEPESSTEEVEAGKILDDQKQKQAEMALLLS